MKKKGTSRLKLGGDIIKKLFQWDVIKAVFLAAFKKATWKRLFSPDLLNEFFGRDLISALHLLCTLVILTICILFYRSGARGGKVLMLGIFSYFNVFVGVVFARNKEKFEMPRAIWWLLGMWVMAIGVGMILSAAWEGIGQLLGTCSFVGVFALPVMMLDPNFWKNIFHTFFGAIDQAFAGSSIEDIGIGILGAILGLAIGAVILLLMGSLIVVSQYAGLAIDFCKTTGCRFARKEDEPTFAEGVVAEDCSLPEATHSSTQENEVSQKSEESSTEENDEFFIE